METSQRLSIGPIQNPMRGLLHGGAAIASAFGMIFLLQPTTDDRAQRASLLIFGLSLVVLYTVSSLYHCAPWSRQWKRNIRKVDHSLIYVVIAGTYTPLAAFALEGTLQKICLVIVWTIAAFGIAQKMFWPRVPVGYSVTLQTLQSTLALGLLQPLSEKLPWPALALLVFGGLLYGAGMILYVTQRPRLWPRVFSYHELFHVFVVAGSFVHYVMTLVYIVPLA